MQCLVNFESVWEKAKTYFANMKRFLHFSEWLEAIAEKHPAFNESIQNRDAEIFVSIPCLLLLMAVDKEDKNLCKLFCPDMYKEGHWLNK